MPYALDYLLIAEALNGNVIKQTPSDTSLLDPNGSAYTDIVANLPLQTLSLVGRGHIFTVDFSDGSIAVDGRKTYPPHKPSEGTHVKPVYYRTVIQTGGSDGSTSTSKPKYTLGWEAVNHRGRDYNYLLTIV